MLWEKEVKEKFKLLIDKLPFFHRQIAERVVIEKAEQLAFERHSSKVEKEDLAQAFLSEVPEVFRNYLIDLLKNSGLN